MALAEPRNHHYYFAYRAVPDLVFNDSDFVNVLFSADGHKMLEGLWNFVGEQLDQGERLSSAGLQCEVLEEEARSFVTIRLPAPEGPVEAYYIVVARLGEEFRYLTFESMTGDRAETSVVLGEWTEDGTHMNLGQVPASDMETLSNGPALMSFLESR